VSRDRRAPAAPDPGAVGLIGLGEIGQVHAAAVLRPRSARLVAVADTVPELLAPFEARGARGYSGAEELIADPQVGTVCVCLPHLRAGPRGPRHPRRARAAG
jgi:predicted dehydrogenase